MYFIFKVDKSILYMYKYMYSEHGKVSSTRIMWMSHDNDIHKIGYMSIKTKTNALFHSSIHLS